MQKQHSAFYATIWSLIERFSTQIVSFIIGIILARILSPNDYGIVGLTSIFISISNVFIDSGFANGLIRKIDRTEEDLSTAFIFNLTIGVFTYILLWIISPLIASFFNEPILTILVKIVGLNVLFNSLCIVQTAILTARLDVKGQTIINLCTQIPAGIFAIYLAYNKFGLYALALQTVCASFLRVILLWLYTHWKPSKGFSTDSFKYLWRFGSKLLGANLIGTIFNEIYSVLIGKYISKKDLGYYSKSSNLNSQVDSVFSGIIQKIALPILAKHQQNKIELVNNYREFLCYLVITIAPIIAILFAVSQEIIILLWTEKWSECVIIFQILIIGSIFIPISNLSLSLFQVLGHTHTILKLEFPKKMIYIILISIGFYYGLMGLIIARLFVNIIGAIINMWATKKVIDYSYKFQALDLFKYITISLLAGIFAVNTIKIEYAFASILIKTLLVSTLYLISLSILKDKMFLKLISFIKTKVKS